MRPEAKLRPVHPELAAHDFTHLLIHAAQFEFTHLETHGRASVAATARQMEHDGPMVPYQLFDQLFRGRRHADAVGIHHDIVVQTVSTTSENRGGTRALSIPRTAPPTNSLQTN